MTTRLPAAFYLGALISFGIFAGTHARFVWEIGLAASAIGAAVGTIAVVRGLIDLGAYPEWDPDRRIVRTRIAFGLVALTLVAFGLTMQSGAYLELLPADTRTLVPAELVQKPDLLLAILASAGGTLVILIGIGLGWRHARESFHRRTPDPLPDAPSTSRFVDVSV